MLSNLLITPIFAIPLEELQELRLAKAELAYSDGDKATALKLLTENITRKNFHLETYLFIAKIHFSNKDFAKGFRAYYYAVKKLHNDKLIFSRSHKIKETLEKIEKPDTKALQLYSDIANKYYDLFENNSYPEASDQLLLGLSYKYFLVLEHYQFNLADTKYMMSRISQKLKKYNLALEKIIEAKELFIKMDKDEGIEDASYADLDYEIGDILIQNGHMDAGGIYLKNLYTNPKTSPALREYASVYLESLSQTYSVTTISFGFSDYGNLNELNTTQLANFDKDTYKRKTATGQSIGISYFQASDRYGNWQFFGSGAFSQINYLHEEISNNDFRSFSLAFDIKYDNLSMSSAKFGYYGSLGHLRESVGGSFQNYSLTHYFYLQYSMALKHGLLALKFPLTLTDYESESTNDTYDFGGELNFTPYKVGKLWSPTFSASVSSVGDTYYLERSIQFSGAMSNHMRLNDRSSIFLEPSYTTYSNSVASNSYSEFAAYLAWSLYFENIFGISQSLSTSWSQKNYVNGDSINVWTTSINWSFNF